MTNNHPSRLGARRGALRQLSPPMPLLHFVGAKSVHWSDWPVVGGVSKPRRSVIPSPGGAPTHRPDDTFAPLPELQEPPRAIGRRLEELPAYAKAFPDVWKELPVVPQRSFRRLAKLPIACIHSSWRYFPATLGWRRRRRMNFGHSHPARYDVLVFISGQVSHERYHPLPSLFLSMKHSNGPLKRTPRPAWSSNSRPDVAPANRLRGRAEVSG